jgi:hypothetical protein
MALRVLHRDVLAIQFDVTCVYFTVNILSIFDCEKLYEGEVFGGTGLFILDQPNVLHRSERLKDVEDLTLTCFGDTLF